MLQRKIGAGEYKNVADKELLGLLVDAIPPSGRSPKAQIAWVRSTRFLESDSMSLLIDSDVESNNTRQLIFSNLFGVGDYQKAENDLSKILNKLPAASTITREKAKISQKISEYDEAIKKFISEQGEPYRDHALNLLNTIAKHLGTKTDIEKDLNLSNYHKQLEVEFIQSTQHLENQKASLTFMRENLLYYQKNLSKVEELHKSLASENKTLTKLNDFIKQKKEERDIKQKALENNQSIINDLTKVLEELRTIRTEVNRLYEVYKLPSLEAESRGNRLNKLAAFVFANERKISDIKEKVIFVEECIQLLPTWVNGQDSLKGIAIEYEALQAGENIGESLPEQISEVKAKLDALQASRKKALGELDLLLSSGKKYLEIHKHVSECPLCEHHYDSNLVLQEKISNRFSKLTDKSKEEAILISKYTELMKLLEQENSRLKRLQELTGRRNHLIQQAQEIETKFVSVGIAKVDLAEKDTLSLKLETIHKQHLTDANCLSERLVPYEKAFNAGKNIEEILNRLNPIVFSWIQKLELPSYMAPQSIDDSEITIINLVSLLESHNLLKKQQQENEGQKIKECTTELSKAEEEKNKKELIVSSYKHNLSTAKSAIDDFKRKWAVISNTTIIDVQEIEKASLFIDNKRSIHNDIKSFFQKAEYYFDKIREYEKKESDRGTYQKELNELKNQLQEWVYQENARSMIENEINSIKKEIRRFIAQEIQPLSNIINILYLRAQGNRFINSIEARPSKEGFLDWIAELDEKGEMFDKMRSLSQGQRQDLALAIFLARARSLGGTFFLDEPLAHLDDLNRVALLDTLRVIISEKRPGTPLRLVLTTASNNLLRHLREKFSLVEGENGKPALRIYKMSGNPKVRLDVESELVHSPNRLLTAL
jgi:exonuclease SbcC